MWRQTQEDREIPVFNFIDFKKELSKKELKDYKTADQMSSEKFVKTIQAAKKLFQANQVVYCDDFKSYAQIKEVFDDKDGAPSYGVRMLTSKEGGDKNEVQRMSLEQLSETITINVFSIQAKGEQYDISMLDVNINDKLQKLVDLLAVDNVLGSFVFGSKVMNEEKLD